MVRQNRARRRCRRRARHRSGRQHLVVRATGKLHLDVTGSGGVTAANKATHAPSGTEEHRFKIAATGTATLRGVGDDLTWAFSATPDKPPTIALTKDPEQQNRGAMLLSYRVEDDYGATEAHATFARKDEPAKGDGPHPLYGPPAGIYLGLRSIFWSLVRAKSDDDLREVAARRAWRAAAPRTPRASCCSSSSR